MSEIRKVRVGSIHPNPDNPRTKLEGIAELAASIGSELGMLQRITVRVLGDPSDELFMVQTGHRRLAAIQKLGWEEVEVEVADTDDLEAAKAAIAENTARDELSVLDEAAAVGRLAGLEVSDEEIIASLGIDADRLASAKRITGASAKARKAALKAAEGSAPTLDQYAVLTEFADDEDALRRLGQCLDVNPARFDHVVAGLREDRAFAAKVAELVASVGDVPTLEEWDWWTGPKAGTEPLVNLLDAPGGKGLTAAKHAACPGHRAVLENCRHVREGKPKVTFACEGWEANGHALKEKPARTWQGRRSSSPSRGATGAKAPTEAEREKATKERRAVIANNKAWGPATSVRHAFLRKYLMRKTLTASARDFICGILTDEPGFIDPAFKVVDGEWMSGLPVMGRGGNRVEVDKIEHGRRWVLLLAQVVAHAEAEFKTSTWRPFNARPAGRYLTFLQGEGYELSDVERVVIKAATK